MYSDAYIGLSHISMNCEVTHYNCILAVFSTVYSLLLDLRQNVVRQKHYKKHLALQVIKFHIQPSWITFCQNKKTNGWIIPLVQVTLIQDLFWWVSVNWNTTDYSTCHITTTLVQFRLGTLVACHAPLFLPLVSCLLLYYQLLNKSKYAPKYIFKLKERNNLNTAGGFQKEWCWDIDRLTELIVTWCTDIKHYVCFLYIKALFFLPRQIKCINVLLRQGLTTHLAAGAILLCMSLINMFNFLMQKRRFASYVNLY